ncbi:uncharacterized protein FIBRA_04889 [Fibroporia radiculosa]|uniref:DUF1793 domain-containing protein n=1 Tax=Fibroporia radiculosa TaxID=599839 RepID=J4IAE7_9APHY|nr:uncharacterized protein FIBRA_04889 [Fibroporia radiculosa]CCM02781.1 predicted protein [Fibroporia radiculosa]
MSQFPQFWPTDYNLGWTGYIRVDGTNYKWLGGAANCVQANLTSFTITPTQTIYNVQAGPMDVTVVFLSPIEGPGVTFQASDDNTVRGGFQTQGSLNSQQEDTDYRAISDNWPTFAMAVDLGNIQTISSPLVWTVGYVRDPSIKYTTAAGITQLRYLFFRTKYSATVDLIVDFLSDYSDALARSESFDSQLIQNASSISTEYSQVVALSTRQVFGAIDITVSNGTDGSLNASDVMIFMRNMGINQRVNPVEILYASFPAFLYINASFGKPLLAPLLEYQGSPKTALPYAMSDLGTSYPIASGEQASDTESSQGVEQCGNMLIMTLAHARFTGDGSLVSQHYDLLRSWATYLVENSETPTNQVDADSQSAANMTNLAIKGIIGIQAMAEMSEAIGNASDFRLFSSAAATYINAWQSLAVSSRSGSQHIKFTYQDTSSWTLAYNLYADRLLETNLINQSLYSLQTQYYQTMLESIPENSSLEYDSNANGEANDAWLSFTAATATDATTRNSFLSLVWNHASSNLTAEVFPTTYGAGTGNATQGFASPAQGAIFAPLTLDLSSQTITFPPPSSIEDSNEGGSKNSIGAIVGGVVGGVVGFIAVVLAGFFVWRRSQQSRRLLEKDACLESSHARPFQYEAPLGVSGEDLPEHVQLFAPLTSQKLRGHLQVQALALPISSGQTVPSTSQEPPSISTQETHSPSAINSSREATSPASDMSGLRAEMENLRRAVEQIAAPPEYVG